MSGEGNKKDEVRWGVFLPAFLIIGGGALLGILKNDWLTKMCSAIFGWSLKSFGWLYQLVAIFCLVVVIIITFSKIGNVRFGGKNAKSKHSFGSWFAMTLTGGIATGCIVYGANEVMIYYGNIYGELSQTGLAPLSQEAAYFGMGRVFYNWTFIPYAMYSIVGCAMAYIYFNKKEELSVAASLTPLFGQKIKYGFWRNVIDVVSIVALALGLSSNLGMGLALIGSGLEAAYGIAQGPIVWFTLFAIITATFTIASVAGLDKGIKWLANGTTKIFYALLFFLVIAGPTVYICNMLNVGLATWGEHFLRWGFDPYIMDGEALVTWWTMFDWACWIAYAPLMAIFFAMISYGRTIRQFMIVNWILPSSFGLVWFSVWSGTALNWQQIGKADLIGAIQNGIAVSGLWELLKKMPLSVIIIPLVMITMIAAFSTTADTMSTTISQVCTKGSRYDREPANWQKVLWGVSIGIIAVIMVIFGGGQQGVEGVKYLSGVGGFCVLPVFILQLAATFKVFFIDKIIKEVEEDEITVQPEMMAELTEAQANA